jgi:hypothetical protein
VRIGRPCRGLDRGSLALACPNRTRDARVGAGTTVGRARRTLGVSSDEGLVGSEKAKGGERSKPGCGSIIQYSWHAFLELDPHADRADHDDASDGRNQ